MRNMFKVILWMIVAVFFLGKESLCVFAEEDTVSLASENAEPSIVSISANVVRDTFYYEVEFPHSTMIVDSVVVTYNDGTVSSTYNTWHSIVVDYDGNPALIDENGKYPVGNYICKIYESISGLSCEVPIQILSRDSVAIELAVGETLTGLSGTENYEYDYKHGADYNNGHWLKIDFEESGSYELSKSEEGTIWICDPSDDLNYSSNSKEKYIQVSEAGTYYCCVKGSNTFDVTLTKLPEITEINANIGRSTFYYEVESVYTDQIVDSFDVVFSDGTTVNCPSLYFGADVWNDLRIRYGLEQSFLDSEGNEPTYDTTAHCYLIGEYFFEIIYPVGGISSGEIPVKVVSLDDVAIEIGVGETISDLPKLDENNFYEGYANGHWIKMELTEPGEYLVSKDSNGMIKVIYPDGSEDGGYNFEMIYISASETGCYYCFVRGMDTFNVTLTKVPIITNIEAEIGRDIFFYEVERAWEPYIVDYLELTCEDGSNVKCSIGDEAWYRCHLEYLLVDANGNIPDRDSMYKCPIGDYRLQISQNIGGVFYEVPIKVVSVDEIELEMKPEETIYGLSGTDKELNSSSYRYGHWIRLNITEPGVYELSKSELGIIARTNLNDFWPYWTINTKRADIQITESGCYYCYVKGSDTFDITLNKLMDKTLDAAVDEMVEISGILVEESLANASAEEKQEAVAEVLQSVGIIYESYDIAEIGEVSAEKSIESVMKLTEIEERVEALLDTSVEVVTQDEEAETLNLTVANALLSVPAGECAEIRVSIVEIPEDTPITINGAIAIKVQLISEDEEKLQLQAPVVITMNVPDGINVAEEIVVYHCSDDRSIQENVPIILTDNGKMSFVIGSFSTLVFANEKKDAVTDVTLDKFEVTLSTGESVVLSATVSPSDTTVQDVTWKSDNTEVAIVNDTGKVTAVAAGSATITATAADGSGISASCKVTVTQTVVVDPVVIFVTRMYQQCLSRDPDQSGLEGWVSQLEGGYMNGAQIAEQFVFSNEMLSKNLSDEEFVNVLYRAMMGREADEAGRAGWVNQLSNGYMTRSEVTKAFVESTEFSEICSSYGITRGTYDASIAPIEHFVTRFYTLCLERKPDQAGLYGWVNNLKNQYMNGAQIAEQFFFSDEFVARNVSDEKYIELLYNTLMGRPSDENGKTGWLGQLQNGNMTRRDMMKAFIESNEFTGICESYGITRGTVE